MTLKQHGIQASVGSVILAPFLGVDVIIFFLSVIFIDVDHYFEFAVVCKRFGIRDMFRFHNLVWQKRQTVYGLSFFHTVEIFLLLFILGFWSHYFWFILFGFFVHLSFDLYYLYTQNCFFNRAFSIVEYLIRRNGSRRYPVHGKEFWDSKDVTLTDLQKHKNKKTL